MNSKIPILNLIKMAFFAVAHPNKAFKQIPDASPNYVSLIALLALAGFILSITNNFLLEEKFALLTDPYEYLSIILYSIFLWIFGSLSFYLLANFFKKKVPLEKIEIGVFYIWLVWAIVPPFFLPHILFHLKRPLILGATAHIGWIWFFIMIPLLSFFMVRDLIGLNFKTSLILSIIIPLFGKYFLEEIPLITFYYFLSRGRIVGFWQIGIFVATLLSPPVFLCWLAIKRKASTMQYFAISTLISAALLAIVSALIFRG